MPQKRVRIVKHQGCQVRCVHLDRVKRAKREAVPDDELLALSALYKALGDPTRLKILTALAGGEMCVCDLAALLGVSDSAVSHQLRRLRDLSLVRTRRESQVLYYSLDDNHVADLVRVGLEHVRE